MATEATFTVESDEFPLGTIFGDVLDVTVELDRIIPGQGVITPYFWVRGVDIDDIESVFSDHPGVRDIRSIDAIDDEYLLRVEWDAEYDGILGALAETEVPLVSAVGTNEQWTFDIRGDNRSDIADFHQLCRERDIPITLTALHAMTAIETTTEQALTDTQKELLVLAYERGYFNTPRDVTMDELGEELGISQQAVASRLRRGIESILGQTIPALDA